MPPLSEKLQQLLREVSQSGERKSDSLVGEQLTESGLLDRAVLNQQIGKILQDASANESLGQLMERHLDAFQDCIREGNVAEASTQVCALLNLEMNDLRRAALLSLMVRMAGKRKFDPVATYILENRAARVTGRG
jgi:hypothetical protein